MSIIVILYGRQTYYFDTQPPYFSSVSSTSLPSSPDPRFRPLLTFLQIFLKTIAAEHLNGFGVSGKIVRKRKDVRFVEQV